MTVVLLGPQRFNPTVASAAAAIGVSGRFALITAGWQEREAEDEELTAHLGAETINLALHRRADTVFARDPELAEAYRARQRRLRQLQDFYRIRLTMLVETARMVSLRAAPEELLEEQRRTSVESLRVLDRYHLSRCREEQDKFAAQWAPHERDAVARERAEIRAALDDCAAVAIAGGHVASLLNRLRLFGVGDLWEDRPVLAWSAGAMCMTERVVLFHDDPPGHTPVPQLLVGGLGAARGVVALPNPHERLALCDPEVMATYAQRFAPATCLALPRRAWVVVDDGAIEQPRGVIRLDADGTTPTLGEEAA